MKILNKKAISVIEYALLFIIIIGAFLVMRTYIQRGIYSNWKQSGQSYGFGRQYDSQKTIDCAFDAQSGSWYDHNCYEYYINQNQCNGRTTCEENVINSSCSGSSNSYCAQLNNGASL